MDDRLRLIQSLYTNDEPPADLRRRLADDDVLRREYEALRETKEALDQRPSRAPEAAVVDRVVAQAKAASENGQSDVGEASPSRSPAADRSPRRPSAEWTRRLQGVSAAVAIVLMAGIGWWAAGGDLEGQEPASNGVAGAPSTQAETVRSDEQAIPAWDDRDELVRLHRRIERLQSQDQMGSWNGQPQPVQSTP